MRTADGRSHTIRNVIWDVDGTLFDTYPAIARAFGAALADLGAQARIDRIEALARVSLGHCATTLAVEQHLDPAALDEAFGRHYERRPRGAEPVFPGARDVCARIRQGGGQNVIVTHRGPRGTAELLAASDLTTWFTGCITSADGYPRKPDPAAFNAIIERCGLERDQTLAIGDREIDILAGKAAGVVTCRFGRDDPTSAADLVIDDFGQLLQLLEAQERERPRRDEPAVR